MKTRGAIIVVVTLVTVIGLNAGCLSLHLFNRESADTRARLEALERRISALEMASGSAAAGAVVVPGEHWQLSAAGD
ncbi:MAG: hypothetical protein MUF48_06005 [Pirellulaceae bacterium]|jgi:hypothetical protein|nr:hypothetical protein [Pirellulaceae bacterium]